MNIKRIIKEELDKKIPYEYYINIEKSLNESDELEWIKDVKSNKDIAQEIANETEIKNNKIYSPFLSPFISPLPPTSIFYSLPFFTYCEEQYGLSEDDINDVWNRYKKLTNDKVNNLNESNDFSWIKDTIPTLEDALYNRLLKVGDIVTLSGKLVDLEHKKRIDTDNFKVKIEKLGSLINSSDFTPLQKEYWGHLGYMDEPLRFAKEDGEMSVVSIE